MTVRGSNLAGSMRCSGLTTVTFFSFTSWKAIGVPLCSTRATLLLNLRFLCMDVSIFIGLFNVTVSENTFECVNGSNDQLAVPM